MRKGEILAFATETVYGLGADASNDEAVLAIYERKKRPQFNPLIVHCADFEMAQNLVIFPPLAQKLAQKFWPGPLTLILKQRQDNNISKIVSAGLETLAVRVPAHNLARKLIKTLNRPIAAPSANISGSLSPTRAEHVLEAFNNEIYVLEGGQCEAGLESTIIAVEDNKLFQLRAGALPREIIEKEIGQELIAAGKREKITAPGMLKSHYAPRAKLVLNVTEPKEEKGAAYLAFGAEPEFGGEILNLSPSGNVKEAARNLFSHLHKLDKGRAKIIYVAPIPNIGLGEAINDRLRRAAS